MYLHDYKNSTNTKNKNHKISQFIVRIYKFLRVLDIALPADVYLQIKVNVYMYMYLCRCGAKELYEKNDGGGGQGGGGIPMISSTAGLTAADREGSSCLAWSALPRSALLSPSARNSSPGLLPVLCRGANL